MKYIWLIYLQFLFVAGQFNAKKNWIDKHILICYNKLDELNVDYVKFHFIQAVSVWAIIFIIEALMIKENVQRKD